MAQSILEFASWFSIKQIVHNPLLEFFPPNLISSPAEMSIYVVVLLWLAPDPVSGRAEKYSGRAGLHQWQDIRPQLGSDEEKHCIVQDLDQMSTIIMQFSYINLLPLCP